MNFQSFEPSEALRPYIQRYIYIKADGSTDTMLPPEGDPNFRDGHHIQKIFPCWGMLGFVFNACARYNDKVIDQSCYVIGTLTQAIEVETLSGWFEALIVEFRPAGIRGFLDIDLMQVHETVFGVDDVHAIDLHPINDEVHQLETIDERIAAVDRWLVSLLNVSDPDRLRAIQKTVEAAEQSHCQLSVAEMSAIACLSERQFSRCFRTYVGLTPKEFLRMLRWQMTLRHLQQMVRNDQPIDYHEIALHMGYYDMSHMAMEFRSIGCTSPANFRQLGLPLTEDFTTFFG